MSNCKFIAHRGASFDAPENTLSAIRLAWQQNADAVEIDVRLSKDGVIILMHDESTLRTAGHDSPVGQQLLAQLKSLDAGVWKGSQFAGEKIPTLQEVLAELPDGKELVVEIKEKQPEIVSILKRDIEASKVLPSQITLICFDFSIAKLCKLQMPTLKVLPLYGQAQADKIEELLLFCQENQLDGLDLYHSSAIDRELTDRLRAQNLLLYLWTVNDAETARRLAKNGVDGITTDRPGWLREEIK